MEKQKQIRIFVRKQEPIMRKENSKEKRDCLIMMWQGYIYRIPADKCDRLQRIQGAV